MTLPPSPTPDAAPLRARDFQVMLTVLAGLVLLKAFALGASGSISALAGLVESGLALAATGALVSMPKWRAALPPVDDGVAEAVARLVQSGMALSAALIVGVIALFGVFEPRPVSGGLWAVGAIALSLGFKAALAGYTSRRGQLSVADAFSYSDLVPTFVVLLGVTAGAMLKAPGLDAAAGLVVAVWLFWGAVPQIVAAARLLGRD
jgi:divalent metal cation (Fe/Co/Zn/Cd) transporter